MIDIQIKGNRNTTLLLNQLKASSKQYPPLNKEQERELIEKNKDNPDKLNELLFMHNIRLVFSLAKHYKSKVDDFDTLVQDGMVGLSEATKRFDPNRNIKFCTYCVPWVKKYLLAHFYGKQAEMDKVTTSMDAPCNNPKNDPNDQDVTYENFINVFADPTCTLGKSINAQLSADEQVEICQKLYDHMNQDTSLSAQEKEIFTKIFVDHEKTRDLSEKYNLDMVKISDIKHKILAKFKDILKSEFKIKSYQEVGI